MPPTGGKTPVDPLKRESGHPVEGVAAYFVRGLSFPRFRKANTTRIRDEKQPILCPIS